jgi:hypothetical protein
VGAIGVGLGLLGPPVVARAVITWPGPAPCDATLQACIDAAPSGAIVEVATSGEIDEEISIQAPLTLRAQSGSAPSLGSGHNIFGSLATGSGTIHIEGFTIQGGEIAIVQLSTGTLTAEIVGNTIPVPRFGGPAIQIYTNQPAVGAVIATVAGNHLTIPDEPGGESHGIDISLYGLPDAGVTVSGNTISMGQNGQGGAIEIYGLGSVDVIGNRVEGLGFDDGITYSAYGGGTVRIFDNVVRGQSGNSGEPAAILVDTNDQTTEAYVGNNTLIGNATAIFVTGRADLGGYLEGGVENNLITGSSHSGLLRDPSFTATVFDGYNLFDANAVDVGDSELPETPGPGSVLQPPLLDAAGRLLPGSPGVDQGDTPFVPQDLSADVEGMPRIQGAAVDIGAYELSEPAPVAAVTIGTPTSSSGFGEDATTGWEFTLTSAVRVTAFGYWYDGYMNEGHPVGIFYASGASAGTLAGPTATVPAGFGSPVGGFLWVDLPTPFRLEPGTYRIGGYTTFAYGQGDAIILDAGPSFAAAPGITYLGSVANLSSGTGLTYPDASGYAALGLFGPNFQFEPAPEPASAAFAALAALAALGRIARRP